MSHPPPTIEEMWAVFADRLLEVGGPPLAMRQWIADNLSALKILGPWVAEDGGVARWDVISPAEIVLHVESWKVADKPYYLARGPGVEPYIPPSLAEARVHLEEAARKAGYILAKQPADCLDAFDVLMSGETVSEGWTRVFR
jgi:hypothetical protein